MVEEIIGTLFCFVYWHCGPSVMQRCEFRRVGMVEEREERMLAAQARKEGVGLLGRNVKENGLYIGAHFSFRMGPKIC
jgi:hypothetical protein